MPGQGGVFDEATRRDSIFPSDLDGEDQQTQTFFEPFKTDNNFNRRDSIKEAKKNNMKTIPPKAFQFIDGDALTHRPTGIEHILRSPKASLPVKKERKVQI